MKPRLLVVPSLALLLAACAGAPNEASQSTSSPVVVPYSGSRNPNEVKTPQDVFGYSAVWSTDFCLGGPLIFGFPANEVCKVGDVNGDGFADLIAFSRTNAAQVSVALSNGSTFGPRTVWLGSFCGAFEECDVGDVDGDGKTDIIAFTQGTSSTPGVEVALSNGSAFGAPYQANPSGTTFCPVGDVCEAADFNGDGLADVIAFDHSAKSTAVWVSVSNGHTFSPETEWSSSFCTTSQVCKVGDVNGDGDTDVVAFDSQGSILVGLASVASLSDGGSPTAGQFNGGSGGATWGQGPCGEGQQCVVADVTGDGNADVVEFMSGLGGTTNVRVAPGDPGNGMFDASILFDDAFCPAGGLCLVGDFNGDLLNDLVYFSEQFWTPTVTVALGGEDIRLLDNGWPGMTARTHPVYLTYYGTFAGETPSLLTNFVASLGGSAYFSALSSYGIPNTLNVAATKTLATDPTLVALDGQSENTILTRAWGQSLDPNGIYVIFLGSDISDNGCGLAGFHTITPQGHFYAVIKNPIQCAYATWSVETPNDDPEADLMVPAVAHEIFETLTDGRAPGGWDDDTGGEDEAADLCVFHYGSTFPAANTTLANYTANGDSYKTQELWKNGPGYDYCVGAPFSPAPVSYWTFDLAQETNIAQDIMPAHNQATPHWVTPNAQYVIDNQSFSFNGTTSYVSIPDSSSLKFASSGLTVSLWIYIPQGSYPSELGHMFNVLDKQNGTSGWGLWIDATNHPGFNTDGGGGWATAADPLPTTSPSRFHHLAATYKPGGMVKIYVDGVLEGSAPASTATETKQPIWVGSSAYWQNNYTSGIIDEVAIWTQELQASDIQRVMALKGEGPY